MSVKKIKIFLVAIFAFAPLFFLILNISLNTALGYSLKPGDPIKHYSFDVVLMEQVSYFSVWAGFITSLWGIAKIVNNFKKEGKIAWAESENVVTMVYTYNFVASLVFTFGLIFAPSTIPGFNSTYGIVKSSFEHWVVPLLFTFYYFGLRERKNLNIKDYYKNQAWKNVIIPAAYALYVILRSVTLNETGQASLVPSSFPYEQIDPYNLEISQNVAIRVCVTTAAVIAAVGSSYFLSILFEFLSFKSSIKFQRKHVINNILKFRILKKI